uniref:Uncharacterized protein n=1 Tax=Leersia perrieri TaxID=77586 RepID=A0A0D9X5B2_9ORYZ
MAASSPISPLIAYNPHLPRHCRPGRCTLHLLQLISFEGSLTVCVIPFHFPLLIRQAPMMVG